ncbi:HGL269Cp [Eremothecium sinecaudum]|uniref:HGL269Cp n=1 Tax=Eremothecium sinecaudum TaxID=45286 RepID=A0A0X8HV38_9SACH|nr:HGL269Cp [Eremothecium sinecaudum]AMD22071.1 HGL269Cp [Eremothecium sinecaudum]
MLKDQLYILLSTFAARADELKVVRFFTEQKELSHKEILEVISVFWRELDNPTNLYFIFDKVANQIEPNDQLFYELLENDESLIALVECGVDSVSKRSKLLRDHVAETLSKWQLTIDERDLIHTFLKARIILCNELVSDALFYDPLLKKLRHCSEFKNQEAFEKWVTGVLRPLAHLNRRIEPQLMISSFEQQPAEEIMNLFASIASDEPVVFKSVVNFEAVPYAQYSGAFAEFLSVFLTVDNFSLDSNNNFEAFKFMASEVKQALGDDNNHLRRAFEAQLLEILYQNSKRLMRLNPPYLSRDLIRILNSIDPEITIDDDISSQKLVAYTNYMNSLEIKSFKDLHKLSNADQWTQLTAFGSMSKTLLTSSSNAETLDYLIESQHVFNNLTRHQKISAVIESLLSLGEFSLLDRLVSKAGFQFEEPVLLKHFWRFFNSAHEGSRDEPEIVNASYVLAKLPKENYSHLHGILKLADELSQYELSYSRGIPFIPRHILEFKHDPYELIQKLLTDNSLLYRDYTTTSHLLKLIYEGLEIQPKSSDYSRELTKLLVLHVEYAVANMNFQFAYKKTMELFDSHGDVSEYWATFFQVGKYVDPNWTDNETPTEIIYLQLEVLGRLLHICPLDEVEAVVLLWSGLELELTNRTDLDDPYSLSKDKSGRKLQKEIMQQVSTSVSNILTGGYKWAIGDD